MLVNPQLFNYRLTIGVLVITISALAFFGYNGFSDLKSENEFLNHEKKIIQNEITKVISSNNKLEKENKSLHKELKNYKAIILNTSKSVKTLKSNKERLAHNYESVLSDIQNQESLPQKNSETVITFQRNEIGNNETSDINKNKTQKNQYRTIKSEINKFADKSNTPVLKESVKAIAYRVKNNNSKISTKKANKTNTIEICFTLLDAIDFEDKSDNELYLQIIDPNNNVVSDKGVKKFNERSLIYSLKTKPIKDYDEVNVCEYIYSDEKLKKGTYHINIFDSYKQLTSTQLELY